MSACRRDFKETKCMYFLIKDCESLEKENWILEKVTNSIKKETDRELLHNEKCLKGKLKYYSKKFNTNFRNNKIPNVGSQFICLSVNLINFVFRIVKNYYPEVFLEDCKYVVKDKKMPEFFTDDIESFSDDTDREQYSDEDNYSEKN